ncbi:MAG TPA: hypothetical protein VGO67_23155 [Verrucomicrobiae bacterium]|jgi:hypothetical protein
MSDLRTDPPAFTSDLAAAVRFLDAFTGQPVRAPLAVRIPALDWQALRWDADSTYRFSLVNTPLVGGAPQFPSGVFDLEVDAQDSQGSSAQNTTSGPYAALETRQLTLPPTPHSPPLVTDYRVDITLWPTVAFRPPPGETAVVGTVVSATNQNVTGLKVILLDSALPPPPIPPYTRTDGLGQFLFRLPNLRSGPTPNATSTLNVQVLNAGNSTLITNPTTLTAPIGFVTNFVKLNIA